MVQKWLKIVNKPGRKEDLLLAIEMILSGNRDGLDITSLDGNPGYYRCRVGKLRIIFFEKSGQYYIDRVGYRGDVYK